MGEYEPEIIFTYHPPGDDQIERMRLMREEAKALAETMGDYCASSRELSLARTKLEEAIMWANAAIVRNEDQH